MNEETNDSAAADCPNCQTPLAGQYCYHCGQNQRGMDRFFWSLVSEAFENIFSFDSRTARTLFALFFRPGFLATEYVAGRRARYIQPLRLYLIASILFFLFLSAQNLFSAQFPVSFIIDGAGVEASTQDSEQQTEQDAEKDAAYVEADSGIDDIHANLQLPGLSAEQNTKLGNRLEAQARKAVELAKEDPGELISMLLDIAPPVLFVLLPIFALILKLAYLGSARYYTQHLILAVHNHSFIFLALLLEGLLAPVEQSIGTEIPSTVLSIWIPIYMYMSLLRVYGQGYFITMMKFMGLGFIYITLFSSTFLLSLLAGVMTL
ncbi:MAG: DUF3667 domain-containing protein [SAR86 cluster bacterium]|uniref:DUF3667 domain-containing protein n=1 Tax=SAR86 cluster bacterium TaxID=2030880 RepID=A0A972VVR4_9GAMM|nr:DUF3667 domain-containing protein [SAR86 cluster bacterium]